MILTKLPRMIKSLKNWINKEFLKNDINLIDNNLLKQLNSLSHTRNSLAHVGQPDYNRINKVVKNIVDNKSPKTILLFILDIWY